jgi:acetyl-CoA carboxylase biotin carboxyl carrier protein
MSTDLPLTPQDVAEIVAILDGTPYETIDIRTSRFVLRVARTGQGWTQEWDWQRSEGDAIPVADPALTEVAGRQATETHGMLSIRAPLPGTFYHSPQPGASPFVTVGSHVEPDMVVGIIETMKLMNPVHAGVSGVIEAILIGDAAQIHGEAVLMHVRPDKP